MTDKQILIQYLEDNTIPKFKVPDDQMESIRTSYKDIYTYYFKIIDRLEYAFYTETYPYPAFVLHSDTSLIAYNIEKEAMVTLLDRLSTSEDIILEHEFYTETIRIKDMLKLYNQGSIKI